MVRLYGVEDWWWSYAFVSLAASDPPVALLFLDFPIVKGYKGAVGYRA